MGKIVQKAGEYFVEFWAQGLFFQKKAGQDYERAKQILKDVEAHIPEGALKPIVREVRIKDFFEDFLNFCKSAYSRVSFQRFSAASGHFCAFLETRFPDFKNMPQITPSVMEAYRAFLIEAAQHRSPHVKPQMINFTFYLLRAVFDYGIRVRACNDNPTLHLQFLTTGQNPPRTLDPKQYQRVAGWIFKELDVSGGLSLGLLQERLEAYARSHPEEEVVNVRYFRNSLARELLNKQIPLIRLYQILGCNDIAQIMYFAPFVVKTNFFDQ